MVWFHHALLLQEAGYDNQQVAGSLQNFRLSYLLWAFFYFYVKQGDDVL